MANPLQQVFSRSNTVKRQESLGIPGSETDPEDETLAGKIKAALSHLSMYVGLVFYTSFGAWIFQILEHPEEVATMGRARNTLIYGRHDFLKLLFNDSWSANRPHDRDYIKMQLTKYEQMVAEVAGEGIDMATKDPVYQWSYIQAVFFTSTILTTIGYGNIAPVSTAGRVFCILYAIVGIPFTLSVIADVGQIFATIVSAVWKKYKHVLKPMAKKFQAWISGQTRRKRRRRRKIRRATAIKRNKNVPEDKQGLESNEHTAKNGNGMLGEQNGIHENGINGNATGLEDGEESESSTEVEDEEEEEENELGVGLQSNLLTGFFALAFLTGFISVGSVIFTIWEEWTFFESFYFCFITVTTIGLGDIVPDITGAEKTAYMLVCMTYILVGLAFTSTIIELVRRQYAESWRKMQEIRAQLQAQLKLAATLRQMADAAGKNNIEIEGMDIAGDLAALKANLQKYKGQGFSDLDINDLDWMDGDKKVKAITVVIYESSV